MSRRLIRPFLVASLFTVSLAGQGETAGGPQTLLAKRVLREMAEELSGENAHRVVQQLSQWHRMRGSRGFASAASAIRDKLISYGLEEVEIWSFAADGEAFYGTQRSRPAWDAEFAELWELNGSPGEPVRAGRIASLAARPVVLAQDSSSGQVENALLVNVGAGTRSDDYQGLPIHGNLVLTSSQPGAVSALAVDRFGAAGIVSYAQNQRSAWWRQDENLVRWGHLNTFPKPTTFGFMVSLRQARDWIERMAAGESIRMSAQVRAGQHPGRYQIATAVIRGADPARRAQQIVYSCHLDHQRPGANDNASGCAAILEVARGLSKLVREGKIPRPARTLRFVWPPEIEGTLALLNGRQGFAASTAAAIHLDMVGGGPVTKAEFHITRSPASLPTFVNDVAEELGRFVNSETASYADSGRAEFPLTAPEGGRGPLRAALVDLTLGSDHQIYSQGSFRIPAIYFNDWPDRYIHTHKDSIANIDPTKLLRASFLAAASGYFLAGFESGDVENFLPILQRNALRRTARLLSRLEEVSKQDRPHLARFHFQWLEKKLQSFSRFASVPPQAVNRHAGFLRGLRTLVRTSFPSVSIAPDDRSAKGIVYRRRPEPKGPMSAFGYSYLSDHLARLGLPQPKLLSHRGLWGSGSEYAYEALNLVDGKRRVEQIRNDLTAIYGPVPVELVEQYLSVLERIGILERR